MATQEVDCVVWNHVVCTCKCYHQMGVYVQDSTVHLHWNIVLTFLFGNGSLSCGAALTHPNGRSAQQKWMRLAYRAMWSIVWLCLTPLNNCKVGTDVKSGSVPTAVRVPCPFTHTHTHRHISSHDWTEHRRRHVWECEHTRQVYMTTAKWKLRHLTL